MKGWYIMENTLKQKTKKRDALRGYWARHWVLYAMLLPTIIFLFIFSYLPMGNIMIAFTENNVMRPVWELEWRGLENFMRAFDIRIFRNALRNTVMFSILDLIVGFPAPIILAILLNEIKFPRFKKVTQTITYMPFFLSWVIVGGLAFTLFSTHTGAVNNVIQNLGGQPIPFIESPWHWVVTNVLLSVWRTVGWNTIIYLAAITSISPELYEAAEIDGASRIRKMWHITLPGIRPTIITLFILTLGGILGADLARFMALSNSLVREFSMVIPMFIFEWGLGSMQFSLAAAIGILQSIFGMILLLSGNWFVKKLGGTGFW